MSGQCGICGGSHPYDGCAILGRHLAWLRMEGRSEGTVRARRNALARMGRRMPVPLLDATPADLLAWRAGLRLATPGAIGNYVRHASRFYAFAVAEGLCDGNPAAGLPVPRQPRRLPRPIPEGDLMYALDCAPARIRLWIILAAWCGLRACEIAGLRRECILDRATPPVLLVASDATKGTTERTVPLCPFVLSEIAAAGLPATGYAFRRHDGQGGANTAQLVSHLANDHLHSCGIPATLHQMRHRFGTQAWHASKDLRAVQELMGHADPRTTSVYVDFDRPEAAAAVCAIPAPDAALWSGGAR